MKKLTILFPLMLLFSFLVGGSIFENDSADFLKGEPEKTIQIYYFHYSHRCQTCVAVETETKKTLNKFYSEKLKSGQITFQSIDMDEAKGEQLADNMKVSGQTLIFVQAENREDLTTTAFMYAVTNPKKLHVKVKKVIQKLLK